MNRFEELLNSVSPKPAVVVHIGAGSGREHEFYESLNPNRIIWVEANYQPAENPSHRNSEPTLVTILECAVAAESERKILKVTNNPQFSSLANPTGLIQFYPNIEVIDEVEVDALTINDLCQQANIEDDSENILVADLRGLEKEVFPSTAKDTLQKFRWILFRSSEHDLYEQKSNKTPKDLTLIIQEAGYTVMVFNEDTPPFLNILCIRNDAQRENIKFKRQSSRLESTLRNLEHDFSKKSSQLKKLELKFKSHVARLEKSLESKTTEKSDALKQLKLAKKHSDNQQQEIKKLSGIVERKSGELTQIQLQIESLETQKSDFSQQVRTLSKAVDTRLGELAQSQVQIQSLHSEREDLLKQIKDFSILIGAESSDPAKAQVKTLKTEKQEHLKEIKKLCSDVDTKSGELTQALEQIKTLRDERKDLHQQAQKHRQEVDTARGDLTQVQSEIQSLSIESKNQLQKIRLLTKDIKNTSRKLTEAQLRVQSLKSEKAEQLQQIKALTNSVDAISQELAEAQSRNHLLTSHNENQAQKIDGLSKSNNVKEKEISVLRSTLKTNKKLAQKSETDLKDLQIQYRNLFQQQEEQLKVLCELKEKLGQASRFYKKLTLENPVPDADVLSESDTKGLESSEK